MALGHGFFYLSAWLSLQALHQKNAAFPVEPEYWFTGVSLTTELWRNKLVSFSWYQFSLLHVKGTSDACLSWVWWPPAVIKHPKLQVSAPLTYLQARVFACLDRKGFRMCWELKTNTIKVCNEPWTTAFQTSSSLWSSEEWHGTIVPSAAQLLEEQTFQRCLPSLFCAELWGLAPPTPRPLEVDCHGIHRDNPPPHHSRGSCSPG